MGSNRSKKILTVNYRCVQCGRAYGDPEDRAEFRHWLALIVNHSCPGREPIDISGKFTLNSLVYPSYIQA
jgi:hypothetical protein